MNFWFVEQFKHFYECMFRIYKSLFASPQEEGKEEEKQLKNVLPSCLLV